MQAYEPLIAPVNHAANGRRHHSKSRALPEQFGSCLVGRHQQKSRLLWRPALKAPHPVRVARRIKTTAKFTAKRAIMIPRLRKRALLAKILPLPLHLYQPSALPSIHLQLLLLRLHLQSPLLLPLESPSGQDQSKSTKSLSLLMTSPEVPISLDRTITLYHNHLAKFYICALAIWNDSLHVSRSLVQA